MAKTRANAFRPSQTQLARLRQAVEEGYQDGRVTVLAVVDYEDRQTMAQLRRGFLTAFDEIDRTVRLVPVPTQEFNTPQAATLVAQHTFPPDHLAVRGAAVMVNVAKIAATKGGVRTDDLFLAVAKNGTIIWGYTARDKILGTVLPYLDVIFRVRIPKQDQPQLGIPGAKHRHFRSRDILTRLLAGILSGNTAWWDTLAEAYTPTQARKVLGIRASTDWNGWFPDKPYGNLKTDIPANDPRLKQFRFGQRVLVQIGHIEHEAVFARSLGDVPRGCLGVVQGSSSIYFPDEHVNLIDIMFRGGNAWKVLHNPPQGTPIRIVSAQFKRA